MPEPVQPVTAPFDHVREMTDAVRDAAKQAEVTLGEIQLLVLQLNTVIKPLVDFMEKYQAQQAPIKE